MPINGQDTVAVQTPLWLPRCVDPAGGIWSTTRDVLRYARLHLGDLGGAAGASIVQPASLQRMQAPAVPVPGTDLWMGMDWFSQDIDGLRTIFHGGDTGGQHTEFLAVPERGFALILLVNCQPGALAGLATLDEATSQYPGLAQLAGQVGLTRALLAPDDAPTEALTPTQLAAYSGRYVDPAETDTLDITDAGLVRSIELTLEPGSFQTAIMPPRPEPQTLAFLAADQAIAGALRLPFVRNASGGVGWLADGLRLRPHLDAG
jgi:CubicO group peptidase (beta-lactamase class C family)